MSAENLLKRKKEEEEDAEDAIRAQTASASKRVALDADIIEVDSTEIEIDVEGNSSLQGSDDSQSGNSEERARISSHKVISGDPTYTHFRMLCRVNEAALIVGKGGETISHLKNVSNTKINVSDNIWGVTERVVHVRGSAENVAKAFGLISRVLVKEDENKPSDIDSTPLEVRLLVPHQMMGYIIGKGGSKLREIQDKSAARLQASHTSLPLSTDRCLNISGVADAIHIAVYYCALAILENKEHLKGATFIFYSPESLAQQAQVQVHTQQHPGLPPNPLMFAPMNFGPPSPHPHPQQIGMGLGFNGNGNRSHRGNSNRTRNYYNNYYQRQQQHQQNYQRGPLISQPPSSFDVFYQNDSQGSIPNQVVQEIFVPDGVVGNIIGKNGRNIRAINESSGSIVLIAAPEPNSTERKLTITGTPSSNQIATALINKKIEQVLRNSNESSIVSSEQR